MGPIDNKPALAKLMAWRWTGDKPLPEPLMTQFIDAYVALGANELIEYEKVTGHTIHGLSDPKWLFL